jgi:malonyl-CoA O-methyltransferase
MRRWDKKRKIMRQYDATAHLYDARYAEEQTLKYEAALESMRDRRFGLVLDAGCGTGLLFDSVADKAEMTLGLDISKETLFKAKKRAENLPNVHLVCADADNMPLKEKTFTEVFAVTLIQNTPAPAETLNEIERVSKYGAIIVVTGLKKVLSRRGFESLLRESGLKMMALKDRGNLKCYVAICAMIRH